MTPDQFEELLNGQKQIQQDVGSIKRAIYGDELNKVPGLIDRQMMDEERITNLETVKKKFIWVAGGFMVALHFLKELLLKYFDDGKDNGF